MTLQTSTNPTTAKQEATAPGLLTLQMQAGSIGKIAESVNAFRGEILLPLEMLTLRGRGGLEAKVILTYSSGGVPDQTNTWNLSAPAGIAGLGWSLPFEFILLENDSLSPYDAVYYLASNDGSRNQLYLLEQTADVWRFEAHDFDFAEIRYFPKTDSWQVRTADGLAKEYGTDPTSRYHAVKWGGDNGNWVGSGTQSGQSQFVRAWNLAALRNVWGDAITFAYTSETLPIGGPAGLPYTRACYLSAIADSAGRAIRFNYDHKVYGDDIKEYEKPHVNPAPQGPEAYQDRFETRFLRSIDVTGPGASGDERLFTVHLDYSVDLLSDAVGTKAYLYKRYLRGISIAHADGAIEPGMQFGYHGDDEQERGDDQPIGVLNAITYPDGGRVRYTYTKKPLAGTSLDLTLTRDKTGAGVPRIWFGDNYIVLTRYDVQHARTLTVNVYDWNGRWIGSQPLIAKLSGDLVPGSLQVTPTGDGLVLTLRTRGAAAGDEILTYAITRRFGRFGEWDVTSLAMPKLQTQDATYQVVAGEAFIAAAATDVRQLYRYSWEPRERAWVAQHLSLDVAGEFSLGGYRNYVSLCAYDPRAGSALLTVHYLDPQRLVWTDKRLDTIAPILWDAKLPKLSWSNAASFATATYLTGEQPADKTVSYATRTYLWNRDFGNVRTESRSYAGVPQDTPEPFFYSRTSGSLVGNIGNLLRYNGNTWGRGYFGPFDQGKDITHFAYGDDIAIGTMDSKSRVMTYDPYSNKFLPMFEIQGGSGPAQPTISERCVTVRGRVYYRAATGALAPIGSLVEGTTHVANHGPNYLAYGTEDGPAYVWLLKNGTLDKSARKLSGRLFPPKSGDPGMVLTGSTAFATYTGPSFDAAEDITLHRLLRDDFVGSIGAFVVTRVTVDDGLGNVAHNSYDHVGDATTGPYGLAAQFSAVKVVIGSDDPALTPHGSTLKTFFNGLVPAGHADTTPYALLNGQLAAKQSFDSAGRLVQEERYAFEAVRRVASPTDGSTRALAGAYVRQTRSDQAIHDPEAPSVPPVTTSFEYAYDEANGQPRKLRTNNFNSEQQAEVLETEAVFAYERYPELIGQNVLTATALRTSRVNGAVVRITASTWKQDWGAAGEVWAPHRDLRARTASAVLRDGDWSGQTPPDGTMWRLDQQYEQRDRHGNVTEAFGADGVPRSTIFDGSGLAAVATFRNARRSDDQCTYLGFERYESAAPWTLGGSVDTLWAAVVRGDSHAGSQCLRLAGASGATPGPALAAALALRDGQARTYLLSCWVKTPAGYTGTPGAAWTIRWGGATRATVPVPETKGEWQQLHQLVDVPAAPNPVTISLELVNADPGAVLVDDVRFGPAVGDCSIDVLDPIRLPRRVAAIAAGGATTRWLYAEADTPIATVEPGEALTRLDHAGVSRGGNGGSFDPDVPNSVVGVRPQDVGISQRFDASGTWWRNWRGDAARWQARDGGLHHVAGEADVLAFTALPASLDRFGIALRVRTAGPLAAPLGLQLGDDLQLAWVPAQAAWRLDDKVTGKSVAASPRARLYLDYARYAPGLDGSDASALRDAFARAAVPLTAAANVQILAKGASWIVADAAAGLTYYLVRDDQRIAVVTLPVHWLLVIAAGNVVLFADGVRVVSHPLSRTSIAPAIFATDAIELDNVVAYAGARCQITYQNGAGQTVQEQVLDGASAVAIQTVIDGVGRPAVTSMGAKLEGGQAMFGYEPGLATFDWTTFALSGFAARQNASAGFAPYARARFEDAPLGRQVETGLPGADFAIDPSGSSRTLKTSYGLNDAGWGLPAAKYLRKNEADPSGGELITLTDHRGFVVRSASRLTEPGADAVTAYRYDASGNLIEIVTPRGTKSTFTYDFLGQQATSSPAGEGTTRFLRDRAGRLRFQMDANGAAHTPPYVRYFKYDVLSRVIEEGCFAHAWDAELVANVDAPTWPAATPSNAYTYDGLDRGDLLCLGRLAATTSGNQTTGPGGQDDFTAVERYDYDVRGRTTRRTLRADRFRAVDYALGYAYDNLGGTASIVYPNADGGPGRKVEYARDALGRPHTVRVDGEVLAEYTYDANGRVQRQALYHGGKVVAERAFTYNAPGWLTRVSDPFLTEESDYTAGRYPDGGGYYNGNPAQVSTAARDGQAAIVRHHEFDLAGRVTTAAVDGAAPVDYDYDANGNTTQLGDAKLTYDGGDRLVTRTAGGETRLYVHDANGNEVSARSDRGDYERTLEYDGFRGMALGASLVANGAAQAKLAFRYGHRRRRVFKSSTTPHGTATVLYVRENDGAEPLVELGAPGTPTVEYIRGPEGVLAIRVDGTPYFVSRDRQGSIRALFDPQGTLVAGYDYQPFGDALGPAFGTKPELSRYRFAERELEPVGLYDFRARLYDPVTGRFVSPDPAAQFASPYLYAGDNPTWNRDETGEVFVLDDFLIAIAISAIIGAVAGSVGGAVTIATKHLSGGAAAGAFFTSVAIGAGVGALGGALGYGAGLAADAAAVAVAPALGEAGAVAGTTTGGQIAAGVATRIGVGVVLSAATGTVTGGLFGVLSAAAAGTDALEGLKQGALAGALGGAVSEVFGSFGRINFARTTWAGPAHGLAVNAAQGTERFALGVLKTTPLNSALGILGGVAGGAAGGALRAKLKGDSGTDLLVTILSGAGYGLLSGALGQVKGLTSYYRAGGAGAGAPPQPVNAPPPHGNALMMELGAVLANRN